MAQPTLNKDRAEKLYNSLKESGYDIGSDYMEKLSDSSRAPKLYQSLLNEGYDIGSDYMEKLYNAPQFDFTTTMPQMPSFNPKETWQNIQNNVGKNETPFDKNDPAMKQLYNQAGQIANYQTPKLDVNLRVGNQRNTGLAAQLGNQSKQNNLEFGLQNKWQQDYVNEQYQQQLQEEINNDPLLNEKAAIKQELRWNLEGMNGEKFIPNYDISQIKTKEQEQTLINAVQRWLSTAKEKGVAPSEIAKYKKLLEDYQALQNREYNNNLAILHRNQNELQSTFTDFEERIKSERQLAATNAKSAFEKHKEKNGVSRNGTGYLDNLSGWTDWAVIGNLNLAEKHLADAKKTLLAPYKNEGGRLSNMWKGAKDNFSAADFISFGLDGLMKSVETKQIIEKAAAGKELNESESLVMDALLQKQMIDLMRANDISKWYRGGQIAEGSAEMMAQFFVTGGIGNAFSKLATKGVKAYLRRKLGKEITEEVLERYFTQMLRQSFAKRAAVRALDNIGNMAIGGTFQGLAMPLVYQTAVEATTPTLLGKNSEFALKQYDIAPAEKNFLEGMLLGIGEVTSERSGAIFSDIFRGGNKILRGIINKVPANVRNSSLGNALGWVNNSLKTGNRYLAKTGIHGMPEETLEEVFSNTRNYLYGLSTKEEHDSFWEKENLETMIIGFAPMSAIGGVSNIVNYTNSKNKLNKSDKNLTQILKNAGLNDNVIESFKTGLFSSSINNLKDDVYEMIHYAGGTNPNGSFNETGKEINALTMDYMQRTAQVEAANATLTEDDVREIEQNNFDRNIALVENAAEFMSQEDIMQQQIEAATQQIKNFADQKRGTITEVTIQGSDVPVIIKGLSVWQNENGQFEIDSEKSDETLYYINEDGKVLPIAADKITEILSNTSLDDTLSSVQQAILDSQQPTNPQLTQVETPKRFLEGAIYNFDNIDTEIQIITDHENGTYDAAVTTENGTETYTNVPEVALREIYQKYAIENKQIKSLPNTVGVETAQSAVELTPEEQAAQQIEQITATAPKQKDGSVDYDLFLEQNPENAVVLLDNLLGAEETNATLQTTSAAIQNKIDSEKKKLQNATSLNERIGLKQSVAALEENKTRYDNILAGRIQAQDDRHKRQQPAPVVAATETAAQPQEKVVMGAEAKQAKDLKKNPRPLYFTKELLELQNIQQPEILVTEKDVELLFLFLNAKNRLFARFRDLKNGAGDVISKGLGSETGLTAKELGWRGKGTDKSPAEVAEGFMEMVAENSNLTDHDIKNVLIDVVKMSAADSLQQLKELDEDFVLDRSISPEELEQFIQKRTEAEKEIAVQENIENKSIINFIETLKNLNYLPNTENITNFADVVSELETNLANGAYNFSYEEQDIYPYDEADIKEFINEIKEYETNRKKNGNREETFRPAWRDGTEGEPTGNQRGVIPIHQGELVDSAKSAANLQEVDEIPPESRPSVETDGNSKTDDNSVETAQTTAVPELTDLQQSELDKRITAYDKRIETAQTILDRAISERNRATADLESHNTIFGDEIEEADLFGQGTGIDRSQENYTEVYNRYNAPVQKAQTDLNALVEGRDAFIESARNAALSQRELDTSSQTEDTSSQTQDTSNITPLMEEASTLTSKGEVIAEQPTPTPKSYGSENKLITTDRYEDLKAQMMRKMGQLNTGFDPELFAIGTQMAAYHIEAGVRKFADFAKAMIDDLGEAIKPFLKSFYEGVRYLPNMQEYSGEMDTQADVAGFDLETIKTQDNLPQAIETPKHEFKNITEARVWAKENITGTYKNTNTGEDISVSRTAIDKYLSESAVKKSVDLDTHLSALKKLPQLIETSILSETTPDRNNDNHIKEIQRLFGTINYEGKIYPVKITVKATYNDGNKAYSYEVMEIETADKGAGSGVNASEENNNTRLPDVDNSNIELRDKGTTNILDNKANSENITTFAENLKKQSNGNTSTTTDSGNQPAGIPEPAQPQTGGNDRADINRSGGIRHISEDGTAENAGVADSAINQSTETGTDTTTSTASNGAKSRRGSADNAELAGLRPEQRLVAQIKESGKRPTNEQITELVNAYTSVDENGVVTLNREWINDDILDIVSQYQTGGVSKSGRGILDEYYTNERIVDAVRNILETIDTRHKTQDVIDVLEPSVGIGNFLYAVPPSTNAQAPIKITAFEINPTTAGIAKILHPNANVNLRSFETEFITEKGKKKDNPPKYDLIIGNPPYGEHRGKYKGLGELPKIAKYEDYFMQRSIDSLKEGGVLAMVIPSSWLDRHPLIPNAEVLEAYRLPSGVFEGTQVGTDIVILKKRSPQDHTGGIVFAPHNYFENNPTHILGKDAERSNRFGRMEKYVAGTLDEALAAIEKIRENKEIKELEDTSNQTQDTSSQTEDTSSQTQDEINSTADLIAETATKEGAKRSIKENKKQENVFVERDLFSDIEEEEAAEIVEKETQENEIQPIGKGIFGNIYNQFKGKAKEAINFLLQKKEGEVSAVFHNSEIGDIDLIYGDNKQGLKHIVDKHIIKQKDFANIDEAATIIDDVITNGVVDIQENGNKAIIDKENFRVAVARSENGKNWVITAYDYIIPSKNKKNSVSANTIITAESINDGTAVATNTEHDKGTTKKSNTQKKDGRIVVKDWKEFKIPKGQVRFEMQKDDKVVNLQEQFRKQTQDTSSQREDTSSQTQDRSSQREDRSGRTQEFEFTQEYIDSFKVVDYEGVYNGNKNSKEFKAMEKFFNYYKGNYIHDFYYAEGNIYDKLEQLERERAKIREIKDFNGSNGEVQYQKQKKLLEDVLPPIKPLDEINLSPNVEYVKNVTLYVPRESGMAEGKTLKELFFEFLETLPYEALQPSSKWEIRAYVENRQVTGRDKELNQAVRDRRKKVGNEIFKKFLAEELTESQRSLLETTYNTQYNAIYRPDYAKAPLFSQIYYNFKTDKETGKPKPLKLTEVQKAGVGRLNTKGIGLLAHEVGFGKTMSGILAIHEAMTRGHAKRPVIVVPNNSILKQWVQTIYELIPNAKVNILGNMGADYNLTDFMTQDGEISLVTYNGFKRLGFSDYTYNSLASRFNYISEDLDTHQSERDREKTREKAQESRGKMERNTEFSFEDLGFDHLTFDEIHNANHIISKVKLDREVYSDFRNNTQRTSDLGIKTWLASHYIQDNFNGRNITLLSATPFTNKPLEYYSILSLMGNETLQRMGFFNINEFFETFMEADNDIEILANGTAKEKTNVRRFKNNGLFQQLLSEYIDIKGEADNTDLVRPEKQNREYKVEQNKMTEDLMQEAIDLMNDNETALKGITNARLIAFSPYASTLFKTQDDRHKTQDDRHKTQDDRHKTQDNRHKTQDNGHKTQDIGYKEFVENSPKIKAAIDLVEQNYKDNQTTGQIIYSEVGTDFFPYIKEYLIKEVGLNENEVAIIDGKTAKNTREVIKEKYNNNEIKIIIGSPAIKEGMDLQQHTSDMFLLSLPYNFTQLRQIEGRGWRQGNKWKRIRVNYMLTNNSIDVFMLQKLQIKQNLYDEAMRAKADVLDVSDINTGELKMELITDPHRRAELEILRERSKIDSQITKERADLSFRERKLQELTEVRKEISKHNIEQYREWAKTDEWWANNLPYQENKHNNLVAEYEKVANKMRSKGIDVDNIKRAAQDTQTRIAELEVRRQKLEEEKFPQLVDKYTAEQQAEALKKKFDVANYVKERATENKSYFELDPKARFFIGDIEVENNEELRMKNEKFNEELDNFKNGTHKGLLHLGSPQAILQAAGIQAGEITIEPSVLAAKLKEHNLTTEELKGLAKAIQSPMMIYEWGTKAKSIIIVTELTRDNGDKITVAIGTERKGKALEVNDIASIHGKSAERTIKDFTKAVGENAVRHLKDNLRYVEKEKVLDWLGLATPKAALSQTEKDIAKIIQNFENPTIKEHISEKNLQRLTKKQFKRLIDRLKKTGLARNVIVDNEKMREKLEKILGKNGAERFMSVWHGSPYSFEKFDKSKFLTGEGAMLSSQESGFGGGLRMQAVDNIQYADQLNYDFDVSGITAENAAKMQQIKKTAETKGTFMLAPNGHRSNLNERQWLQVRTENFKDWFGDWENLPESASKVIDENGEPLVAAHSTNANFTQFRNTQENDAGWLGAGYYFFGDRSLDAQYGNNVMEVFLNIREPHFANNEDINKLSEINDKQESKNFTNELIDNGYDGVYYNGNLNQEYVAFEPNQIKSATDNNGNFDNASDDIRFMATSKGEVYGFVTAEGDVYIDENRLNANTPIHEFGHLFWSAAMPAEMKQKIIDLLKETEEWQRFKNRHKTQDNRHKTIDTRHKTQDNRHKTIDTRHKTQDNRHKTQDDRHKTQDGAYSYLKTDEQIADEIFNTILGKRGEAKYLLEITEGNISLTIRIINALREFWDYIKDFFNGFIGLNLEKEKGQYIPNSAETRFMSVWHGSPYSFDKFDISKIGTGIGGQAYGYGLYFSDKKAIAEEYAKRTGGEASANLYKVKIHGDKTIEELDFIDFDGELTEGQKNKIISEIEKLEDYEQNENSEIDPYDKQMVIDQLREDNYGSQIQGTIGYLIGNEDKNIAEFLLKAGIDGIKHSSESAEFGGNNYVVFDENAIEIQEQIRLQTQTAEILNNLQNATLGEVAALADEVLEKLLSGKRLSPNPSPQERGVGATYIQQNDKINRQIREAEKEVDTNPTEAQKEAGNYKKGHVKIQGFDISIEQPKGSIRRGVDENGKAWKSKMNNTYGYFGNTQSRDGDHIDVFIGDKPMSRNVFVIDQIQPPKSPTGGLSANENTQGVFDEHKVMLGFETIDEARDAYLSNYEKGWQGLGNITAVDIDNFRKWAVDTEGRRVKPFSEYKEIKDYKNFKENKDENNLENLEKSSNFAENLSNNGNTSQMEQSSSNELYRKNKGLTDKFRAATAQAERKFIQNNERRLTFHDKQDIEKRTAFDLAHKNNLWVDNIYTLGKPFNSGHENTVLLNENDGVVYKSNNLMNSFGNISTLFDVVEAHNQLFPEAAYEIVGFTGTSTTLSDRGAKRVPHIEVILKQPFILDAEHATPQETADFMAYRGFKQINEHTFENNSYIVSDLHPRNVLKNADGNIFVIDNRIEIKENQEPKTKSQDSEVRFSIGEPTESAGENPNMIYKRKFDEKGNLISKEPIFNNGNINLEEAVSQVEEVIDGIDEIQEARDKRVEQMNQNDPDKMPNKKMFDEAEKEVNRKRNKFLETYADQFRAVKQFQGILEANGVKINDYNNFWMQATHISGKSQKEYEKYEAERQEPLIKSVREIIEKTGIDLTQLDDYLILKHGIERNKYYKDADIKANRKLLPDYSGISSIVSKDMIEKYGTLEYAAQIYVNEFENKVGKKLIDDLWQKINHSTSFILEKQLNSGLISENTFEKAKEMFKHYVPLRGFDNTTAEDVMDYSTYGRTIVLDYKNPKTLGRTNKSETPLAYIDQIAQQAIHKGNENELKKTFLRLSRMRNGNTMLSGKIYREIKTEKILEPEYSNNTETMLENFENFENEMKERKKAGEVEEIQNHVNFGLYAKPSQEKLHIVRVYENGKPYDIIFNVNVAIPKAINEINVYPPVNYGKIVSGLRSGIREMRQNVTTRSAAFIGKNFFRDYMFAFVSIATRENAAYQLAFQKNLFSMFKPNSVLQQYVAGNKTLLDWNVEGKETLLKEAKGGESENQLKKIETHNTYSQYLTEFVNNGGETGFSKMEEFRKIQKKLEKKIKQGDKNYHYLINDYLNLVGKVNEFAENVTRFSAYCTSRQMGRSVERSIFDAKELTVNFNRRGAGNSVYNWLRTWFMFTNASVQALYNFGNNVAANPKRMSTAIGTFVALGFAQQYINSLVSMVLGGDDGDDKYWQLSDWDRQNNFCLWTGNGFLKIPISHELRVWYRFGDNIQQIIRGKNTANAIVDMITGFSDLLPSFTEGGIPSYEDIRDKDFAEWGKTLSLNFVPDVAKPLAQLAFNRNFMNTRIYDDNKYNSDKKHYATPGYEKALTDKAGKPLSPNFVLQFTKALNNLTGGNDIESGFIDLNPDVVNHLFRGYFGGIWDAVVGGVNIAEQSFKTGKTLISNEKDNSEIKDFWQTKDFPTVRSFYTSEDRLNPINKIQNNNYYNVLDEAKARVAIYNAYYKKYSVLEEESENEVEKKYYNDKIEELEKDENKIEIYKEIKKSEKEIKKLKGAVYTSQNIKEKIETANKIHELQNAVIKINKLLKENKTDEAERLLGEFERLE